MSPLRLNVATAGATSAPSRLYCGLPRLRRVTTPMLQLLLQLLLLLSLLGATVTPVRARNTCEEIARCSECVYDQTQGFMPPSLQCGWCESSQSCKSVNSTVLAYYGAAAGGNGGGDDGGGQSTLSPEAKAAFRAAFCEDLRERKVNGVCPDMSCRAAQTTNNIYICRAPPLIALVFGCVLFVITVVVYMWMRTIRQLPWKYEPFLSDMLAGRKRSGCDADDGILDGFAMPQRAVALVSGAAAPTQSRPASPQRRPPRSPRRTTRPGSPAHDGPLPLSSANARSDAKTGVHYGDSEDEKDDGDAASAETGSTISNPSYLGNVSHNVVVAHHPHGPTAQLAASASASLSTMPPVGERGEAAAAVTTTTLTAVTGYCPICKCRQPACLGPGEVCFWCNVTRFTFVPFYIASISAVFVIVLDFAVSLKPWFSDWYFAEVLLLAYASYGGLAFYMVRHHGRAPLFFFESEADRRASQRVWSSTHNRPGSTGFSASVPASRNVSTCTPGQRPTASPSLHNTNSGSAGRYDHHRRQDRQRIHLLNDARRNMAATFYFRLAFQLRGRSLLTCFPALRQYEAQLEAMQASPATLTAVGDAVAVMRGGGVASAPGSPKMNSQLSSVSNSTSHRTGPGSPGVPVMHVPVISPFATAVPDATPSVVVDISSALVVAPPHAAAAITTAHPSCASASSPSASSGFEGTSSGNVRLPPLALVAATTPAASPLPEGAMGAARPSEAAAAPAGGGGGVASSAVPTAPPVPPAGGPIGSPAATNVPEALARQKRGETVQLLSSDILSPQYCRALKSTLFRDEYITWCSKPNLRGVLMENEWLLIDLAVGFLFGVWMVMLSSVTDTSYTIVELSGSTAVAACGLIVMALFAVLLIIVVRQCGRLYILTNERLITVYESVVTPVTTATELSTVRFAALYGYRGLWSKHPCLTFSWEVPATERKMPVIKSHMFPGIMNLQEFLFFFRLVAPQTPFHLDQISQSTKQDRQEWRLHIFLAVCALVALPIVTIYPESMPEFLSLFLYVLGVLLTFATLLRGFRAQQMTYAPLNIAASWAPEGELSDFSAGAVTRALPPSSQSPPPPPSLMQQAGQEAAATADAAAAAATLPPPSYLQGTHAASVQAAVPLAGSSPTTRHPPPMPFEVGSRAVQIATPVSRSPVLRGVADFGAVHRTSNTTAFPSRLAEELTTAARKAAATRESRAVPPSIPSHAAAASGGGSNIGAHTTAMNTTTAGAAPLPMTVPVTSAVRELEESLLGVGLGSADNSFTPATSAAGLYGGGTGGSHPGTARNSPHRRRVSSIDVGGVNTGTLSIGPGVGGGIGSACTPLAVVNVQRGSAILEVGGATSSSPTAAAAPAAYVANLSISSDLHESYTPHEEANYCDPLQQTTAPRSRSRSASDEAAAGAAAMRTSSNGTPRTTGISQSSSSISGGGGGATTVLGKGGHHSPTQAHVVLASVRSTQQDGHTTWGDQVAGEA